MSRNFLLKKIKFNKLRNNFKYLRFQSGLSLVILRYNEFFEKTDPFGIKLNTLNFKKLKDGRSGITFLRILRRASKATYYKFTKDSEVHYNLLLNEYLVNNTEKFFANNMVSNMNFNLISFCGKIHKRMSNFHFYSAKIYKVKNWTDQSFNVLGYKNSFLSQFQLRSRPYYNRLAFFGRII